MNFTPPYARMREIAFNARNNLSHGTLVGDETPPEIAPASDAGTSTHAARADHTHGGFDPSNRIVDGCYLNYSNVVQDPGVNGVTTWDVNTSQGRVVIGGTTYYVIPTVGDDTLNVHSGTNLLGVGDSCTVAIIAKVVNGLVSVAAVKGAVSQTPVPPTDEEVSAAVGNELWVRLAETTVTRTSDIPDGDNPAEYASVTPEVDVGQPFTIKATTAGVAGNNIRIKAIMDAPTADVIITRDGTDFTLQYKEDISSVADLVNALDALTGADDLISWDEDPGYNPGTAAGIFLGSRFSSMAPEWTSLIGGLDAIFFGVTESTLNNNAADTGTV